MLNRFMMICRTSCANVLYLHVRIFLSENRKKTGGKKCQANQVMQTEIFLTQKNTRGAQCDDE